VSFDWTTLALEVLNFLVLVWLLQRFLYRPVLAVIEQRRADDHKMVAAAQTLRDEAQALKAQYEAKLAHAAEDRDRALVKLEGEIAAERTHRLAAVEAQVAAERQRREVLEARDREQRNAERDRQAVALGARFATRLLDRLASPALEDKLVELTLADLQAIEPDQRTSLQATLDNPDVTVQVTTAHPLGAQGRASLSAALGTLTGRTLVPEFGEDPALKAGVCIRAGSWVLMANLRDELEFFSAHRDHRD
jgi:F-type H+-transporting ATPase subunit b